MPGRKGSRSASRSASHKRTQAQGARKNRRNNARGEGSRAPGDARSRRRTKLRIEHTNDPVSSIECPLRRNLQMLQLNTSDWSTCISFPSYEYSNDAYQVDPPEVPDPHDDDVQMLVADLLDIDQSFRDPQLPDIHFNSYVEEDEVEAEEAAEAEEPQPPRTPPSLSTLPSELCSLVLRHLLVADRPFSVHRNWQKLYRKQPKVHPEILRASKRFYELGLSVLYGENEFQYRIRDFSSRPDVDDLAHDNDQDKTDNDTHSEYEQPTRQKKTVKRRRTRTNRSAKHEVLIGVRKHLHLFRYISVEAEHNRTTMDTAKAMVEALLVFAPDTPTSKLPPIPPRQSMPTRTTESAPANGNSKSNTNRRRRSRRKEPAFLPQAKPNIRLLTLRISPIWQLKGLPDGGQHAHGPNQDLDPDSPGYKESFTMIRWLKRNSPLIKALQRVQCQYLHVDIVMKHIYSLHNALPGMTPESAGKPPEKNCRLRLIMRPHHADEGTDDIAGLRGYRERRGEHCAEALADLRRHVLARCEQAVPESNKELKDWGLSEEAWNAVEAGNFA